VSDRREGAVFSSASLREVPNFRLVPGFTTYLLGETPPERMRGERWRGQVSLADKSLEKPARVTWNVGEGPAPVKIGGPM